MPERYHRLSSRIKKKIIIADILEETLDEAEEADEDLADLAESTINEAALPEEGTEDDDENEDDDDEEDEDK